MFLRNIKPKITINVPLSLTKYKQHVTLSRKDITWVEYHYGDVIVPLGTFGAINLSIDK
jgi:hypothetical protein